MGKKNGRRGRYVKRREMIFEEDELKKVMVRKGEIGRENEEYVGKEGRQSKRN